ncbi:MAG: hypothetical protein R3261_11375, partial [Alphaproteobacteria bacterium]|nr:hypothetical protein [Alphaproteobacteria bacterium]
MWAGFHKVFFVLICLKLLTACSPVLQTSSDIKRIPILDDQKIISSDGYHLPLTIWPANTATPKAIILGLHGFSDYANGYNRPATL